ncbi:hypothetical protein CLV35_3590 [Motilibacter peucedani]|uniref:YCII-related domain-containing protein n=1 Tax=Motilibacter peucedani TaxID=598650 RepID=A0A420XK01_9ACTN|nr:YciI-like protein [Motilibacter peucedani]RKS68464.1 hypothetical protein CLV35_3590 [Motilibacter peucedani]
MAVYLLEYSYVPDMLERRDPHRGAHLELIRAAHERGELVMAGALADPVDRGLLVWSVDDPAVVEAFVAEDPYVSAGLVVSWAVRPWTLVVGAPAGS